MPQLLKVLIIYTHPNPASFNHAILETVQRALADKAEIRCRELYAEHFQPVLNGADFEALAAGTVAIDVAEEQDLLRWADRLVFIYPVWWLERPALLKGWIDRVFTRGFAFNYGAGGAKGLLHHSHALVFQTTGSSYEFYKEAHFQAALETPMKHGTLEFSGIPNVDLHTFYGVTSCTHEERTAMLKKVEQTLANWE